jgi:serine protease Do
MAVGNPFGLGGTVTAGIISARGRNIGRRTIVNYLQIDAPINKGNSGGPTFNMDGQVIGVNTAIYSPNGGNVGLGFAVPASTAKSVINQLRAKGKISRGWLGVQIQPVTKDIAQALRLKSRDGAMVVAVQPNSPAAKAGLKSGDVIREWDGKTVKTVRDLVRKVANTPANKEVEVGVLRNGKIMTLTAKTKAPKASLRAASAVGPNGNKSFLPSGIRIADLNSNTRRRFRIKRSVKGVVIVAIKPSSAASRKRIRRGDVVTHAGGAPVANKAEVEAAFEAVRQEGREAILLRIVRKGRARFIGLPIK